VRQWKRKDSEGRTVGRGRNDNVTESVQENAKGVGLNTTSDVGNLGDGRLTDGLCVGGEVSSQERRGRKAGKRRTWKTDLIDEIVASVEWALKEYEVAAVRKDEAVYWFCGRKDGLAGRVHRKQGKRREGDAELWRRGNEGLGQDSKHVLSS
jgi:hypothetical protein